MRSALLVGLLSTNHDLQRAQIMTEEAMRVHSTCWSKDSDALVVQQGR